MNKLFVAAAAAAFLIGTGAAMADSDGGNGPKGTPGTSTYKVRHHHHPRYTSGANIQDPGSTSNLPGKDGLNSKAYIQNK